MADNKGLPKLSESGRKQTGIVMKEFYKKKLRSRNGKKVISPIQAKAIAMSEGRSAQEEGISKRTWKGRTRIRPKLK